MLPALRPRLAAVVHPGFTEPEAALRDAGVDVVRVLTDPARGHSLDPAAVPAEADLVVVGNPTNPTGVLHPAATLRELARPDRVLLVDEAFADAIPGEPESLAADADAAVLQINQAMEHLIRQSPQQYLWGYGRYKEPRVEVAATGVGA